MKQNCTYHPARTAHWHCDRCNRTFCPQCVETREMGGFCQNEQQHLCPRCNVFVQWLGVENIIDPFWKRLPQFFLYPFAVRPLLLMLLLSLAAALLTKPGIVGLVCTVAIWGIALKYAYRILQATAGGDLTSPKLNSQSLTDNMGPVLKQLGIYVAIVFFSGLVIDKIGMAVGGLFLFSATLFLPAMIILLVTTGSLLQAINPIIFVTLVLRIGGGYWLMLLFYFILGGAPAVLEQHVIQYLPPAVQVFLSTLVRLYYAFVSYNLMGYVILQYHRNIGYQVAFEDFKESEGRDSKEALVESSEKWLLKRIDQLVKDGDHQGAVEEVEKEMAATAYTDILLSERYLTLLKMTDATEKYMAHRRVHLDLLVRGDRKEEAVRLYLECRDANPDFSPTSIALFKLGVWLNGKGRSKDAIHSFYKLTTLYPADPLAPKSYFKAAQIFNDRLLNPQKAKKILNGLVSKYPGDDIIPYAERYLDQIR